jgi:hypothetical protein
VHVSQAGIGIEVEILPEYEGRDQFLQLRAAIAGERSRLEPRVALPGASLRDEIALQRGERARQRPAVAIGPQARIDAKYETLGCNLAQCADDLAAEPVEEVLIREWPRAVGCSIFRVHEHQIDVGGHIELRPAELAHGHDDKPLGAAALAADRLAEGLREALVVNGDGDVDRDLREARHRRAHLRQVSAPREVAQERAEHHPLAQPAQLGCQSGGVLDSPQSGEFAFVPFEGVLEPGTRRGGEFRLRREEARAVPAELDRLVEVHRRLQRFGRHRSR